MSLDNFYNLRQNFIILGLTGKMQSGADKVVKVLSQKDLKDSQKEFLNDFKDAYSVLSESEARKVRRITDFFNYKDNWIKFDVIDYRNVVLLFILQHNYDKSSDKFASNICDWIIELGTYKDFITPRFGRESGLAEGSKDYLINNFKPAVSNSLSNLKIDLKEKDNLLDLLKEFENRKNGLVDFFFGDPFKDFAKTFFNKLDNFSPYLRHKLIHIVSYCLRRFGSLNISSFEEGSSENAMEHIYIIAEVINRIIKIHRKRTSNSQKQARIIIDRLKNSYELMYFREKYSGFYMVSTNRDEPERVKLIEEKIKKQESKSCAKENLKFIKNLDDTEYKVDEFKIGEFESFDVENCVQKSDYHIVMKYDADYKDIINNYQKAGEDLELGKIPKTNEHYIYQPFLLQLLKLIALIQQPGLVTPTYTERIMQIAYNAKINSGCISRQVGAVVTDSNFSVKGIGWNDVPLGQVPCAFRDLRDLADGNEKGFSNYEIGKTELKYRDGFSFNEKIKADFNSQKDHLIDNLKGRSCPFCFKTFHNTYEAKENQVHTRSLHAEENAMLQISKYGGQPLNGGNLFTTASPCELCSKKAYQLGVKNIFYIDKYPGISQNQILEGGKSNPKVYQYQGAIGRGFFKLYEPFMSIKDETTLRSKIKPSITEKEKVVQLRNILSKELEKEENSHIKNNLDKLKDKENILGEIVKLIGEGISNQS